MASPLLAPTDQKKIDQQILADRVSILYSTLLPMSIPAAILCASVIFASLYGSENKDILLSWYLAMLAISVLRLGLLKWYEQDKEHSSRHLNIFILGLTASAVIWSTAGTLLMVHASTLSRVLIIVILAGLTAGGCQTLQASRLANYLFMIITVLPLSLWLILQKQYDTICLGFGVLIYLGFMLGAANKSYKALVNSLNLRHLNDLLLQKLLLNNQQLENTNKVLSAEIQEHEKTQTKLNYFATHDVLTDLENRRSFDLKFTETLERAKHLGNHFTLFYVDIDKFKEINDTHGHDVGDQLLVQVSNRLKINVRNQDTIARFGGDEFIILTEGPQNRSAVLNLVHRLFEAFTIPCIVSPWQAFPITLSMGSSSFPEDGKDENTLLKKADIALYRAKISGRNQHVFYDDKMKVPY